MMILTTDLAHETIKRSRAMKVMVMIMMKMLITDLAHETIKRSRTIVWWLQAAAVRHQLHHLRVKSVFKFAKVIY